MSMTCFDPRIASGGAGVLVPDQLVVRGGCPQKVDATIAVDVGGAHVPRLRDVLLDDVLHPLPVAVLEPGELVSLHPARGRDVQVSVAVQIGDHDVISPWQAALGDVMVGPRPPVPRVSVVLEPQYAAADVVHHHDLRPAVAVDVRDGVPLQPFVRTQVDDVPGELPAAVVLEPVQADVGVGGDDIVGAVTGDVGGGYPERVGEAAGNQVLGESHVVGHG